MSEYVTLIGAEQVSSAGYAMRDAADQMMHAASSFDSSIERLAGLVQRLEDALQGHAERVEQLKPQIVVTYGIKDT